MTSVKTLMAGSIAAVALVILCASCAAPQQASPESMPKLSVPSQEAPSQEAPASPQEDGEDEPEPEATFQPEASESLLEYASALGEGNTVLDVADGEVDPASDVHGRALSVLVEGLAEFSALPYHSQKSDDVDAVIARYFYSHPNIAYYVYNYTCEGRGSLNEASLALFESGDLPDGIYKAAFTILDGEGAPAAYVDGYYDDELAMYKISDISVAG